MGDIETIVKRDEIVDAVRRLRETREGIRKLHARIVAGEERDAEICRELAGLAGRVATFVADGCTVSICAMPGKKALVSIRPVEVL